MSRSVIPFIFALTLALTACGSDGAVDTADSAVDGTTTTTTELVDDESTDTEPDASGKPEVVIPDGPAPTELEIVDLEVGDGKAAEAGDYLVMHYVGVRHADGGEFDSSWNRDETFRFVLGAGRVIQGWDQGIEGMKEGGRRMLSIPPDLAYGSEARGADIPADSALVFVVDLETVISPPDVENAPAPVTELEITVLDEGDGVEVEAGMVVELHYVAILQTTGEVFATSWQTGEPAVFEVAAEPSQSIPAWDQGLIGLHVGDTVRMVIPPGLGIDDQSGQIPGDATIITELTILGTLDG